MKVRAEAWPGTDVVIEPIPEGTKRRTAELLARFVAREMRPYMPIGGDVETWEAWFTLGKEAP